MMEVTLPAFNTKKKQWFFIKFNENNKKVITYYRTLKDKGSWASFMGFVSTNVCKLDSASSSKTTTINSFSGICDGK